MPAHRPSQLHEIPDRRQSRSPGDELRDRQADHHRRHLQEDRRTGLGTARKTDPRLQPRRRVLLQLRPRKGEAAPRRGRLGQWTATIRKKDGQELKALFIVIAKDNFDEPAQVIQSQFKDVGINLELTTEAEPTVFNTYNRGDQNLANIFWWGADPESLYSLYHSSQIEKGFNWCHYTNPEVDALSNRATTKATTRKRMDLYEAGPDPDHGRRPRPSPSGASASSSPARSPSPASTGAPASTRSTTTRPPSRARARLGGMAW